VSRITLLGSTSHRLVRSQKHLGHDTQIFGAGTLSYGSLNVGAIVVEMGAFGYLNRFLEGT
jgi:hypothetical protein